MMKHKIKKLFIRYLKSHIYFAIWFIIKLTIMVSKKLRKIAIYSSLILLLPPLIYYVYFLLYFFLRYSSSLLYYNVYYLSWIDNKMQLLSNFIFKKNKINSVIMWYIIIILKPVYRALYKILKEFPISLIQLHKNKNE